MHGFLIKYPAKYSLPVFMLLSFLVSLLTPILRESNFRDDTTLIFYTFIFPYLIFGIFLSIFFVVYFKNQKSIIQKTIGWFVIYFFSLFLMLLFSSFAMFFLWGSDPGGLRMFIFFAGLIPVGLLLATSTHFAFFKFYKINIILVPVAVYVIVSISAIFSNLFGENSRNIIASLPLFFFLWHILISLLIGWCIDKTKFN